MSSNQQIFSAVGGENNIPSTAASGNQKAAAKTHKNTKTIKDQLEQPSPFLVFLVTIEKFAQGAKV